MRGLNVCTQTVSEGTAILHTRVRMAAAVLEAGEQDVMALAMMSKDGEVLVDDRMKRQCDVCVQ